ncbi:thiamine pyrophosphate-dependent enzyme, partial [Clostridiaceae bacterium HSG29]|nr:thiamine pyrophosphate-dependent enzyme [Clostridiaceae bacterium HSG29]
KSNTVNIILDNRTTGMTGHQENPGTGYTLQGDISEAIDIPNLVKAVGIKHVITVNPLELEEVNKALNVAFEFDGPSVIITRWPCALKKFTDLDKEEFDLTRKVYQVDPDECKGCKICIKTGCPALGFDVKSEKAVIDPLQCVGCDVCAQACPFDAIKKVGE